MTRERMRRLLQIKDLSRRSGLSYVLNPHPKWRHVPTWRKWVVARSRRKWNSELLDAT